MQTSSFQRSESLVKVNEFIRSVYNWMAIGLALTGFTAYYVAHTPALLEAVAPLFIVFILAELGLVFFLSARIAKMKASTATSMFVIYSLLNGVTLSVIFLIYTQASIFSTFLVTALTFGACSVYGMVTKKDLTSMGQFLFMGLIGIIIASLVNMFMRSPMMEYIISFVGVLVFTGLTAYDTQKIKEMALSQPADASGSMVRKGAIIGALKLYLDFINLFLFMLRFLGNRD